MGKDYDGSIIGGLTIKGAVEVRELRAALGSPGDGVGGDAILATDRNGRMLLLDLADGRLLHVWVEGVGRAIPATEAEGWPGLPLQAARFVAHVAHAAGEDEAVIVAAALRSGVYAAILAAQRDDPMQEAGGVIVALHDYGLTIDFGGKVALGEAAHALLETEGGG